MIIDIKPNAEGKWDVVAHTPSGKAHDCGFDSQAEALKFAEIFYGIAKIIKVNAAKPIPKTTWQRVKFWQTTATNCNCPDFKGRGGSYQDQSSKRVCKHIHHIRSEFTLANRVAGVY